MHENGKKETTKYEETDKKQAAGTKRHWIYAEREYTE